MARSRMLSSLRDPRALAMIATALVALLSLAGCESGTQEPEAPKTEGVEYGSAPAPESAESSGMPSSPAGSGSIAADRFPAELPERAERAIPSNLPRSLPIYPNATPALGMSGNVDNSQRSAMQLLSNDTPDRVVSFYSDELRNNGWEITETQDLGDGSSITATDGSNVTVIFVRAAADGGSDIYQITEGAGDS